MTVFPSELRLEVKSSRSGICSLSERDLDGPGPAGFVVALLNSRLLHGPRWVLVPVSLLRPASYSESELSVAAALPELSASINEGWSDWILDPAAWLPLIEAGSSGLAERVTWCRREHPPRHNLSTGNVREIKLVAALRDFRAGIDGVAAGDSGAQVEGQLHQALLKDGLEQAGYAVLQNPIGVPDIVATLERSALTLGARAQVEAWSPSTEQLREVRQLLLDLKDPDLARVAELLGGHPGRHI